MLFSQVPKIAGFSLICCRKKRDWVFRALVLYTDLITSHTDFCIFQNDLFYFLFIVYFFFSFVFPFFSLFVSLFFFCFFFFPSFNDFLAFPTVFFPNILFLVLNLNDIFSFYFIFLRHFFLFSFSFLRYSFVPFSFLFLFFFYFVWSFNIF